MSAVPELQPGPAYEQRLAQRRAAAAALRGLDARLAFWRGLTFAAIPLAWWLVAGPELLPVAALGLAVALFLALVAWHARVIGKKRRAERAVAFYEDGLRRLAGQPPGPGARQGQRFFDEGHPFAADLDLFGPASLFEHLCRARTPFGEETLARWLLEPGTVEEVRERQAAVAELRPALDLRERLSLLGDDVGAGVAASRLVAWGEAPALAFPPGTRLLAGVLAVVNVASVTAFFLEQLPPGGLLLALLPGLGLGALVRSRTAAVVNGVDRPARDLALLAGLLAELARQRFESPALRALQAELQTRGHAAHERIERLARLMDLVESRRNQLFAPVAALIFWGTQLALSIEAWRAACGPRLRAWLLALGRFEALSSLAAHAFEHPADPFPELLAEGPLYEARGLTHPLLPEGRAVRNDLRLDAQRRLLLVSGSNMSGKSTLLRSVGANLVLAWAGAPVRALALRVSPLALGASLRVHDSLQQGASRFYAEITRLRQVMDLAQSRPPLLFLLDEVLHGTNSGDRRVGAEAVVRGLLERRALGLVTTHDLALAQVAESLAPLAANVHFEDHVEEGRIAFDYRMRPGVVTRSNAVALMRAVGLPV